MSRALPVCNGLLVGIERFLGRTQLRRHVLQVDANAVPRGVAPAHLVDEHVGGLEMPGGLGMAFLPALETGERLLLLLRAADFDQRQFLALGRLHARRLPALLAVVRRPRRVALAMLFKQFEQRLERSGLLVDTRVAVADLLEPR